MINQTERETEVFISPNRKVVGHVGRWYATFVKVRSGSFLGGTVRWEYVETTPEDLAALEAAHDGPLLYEGAYGGDQVVWRDGRQITIRHNLQSGADPQAWSPGLSDEDLAWPVNEEICD